MVKKDRYIFPVVFDASDREISVVFPDLGAATSGVDMEDALLSARELLGCVLCGLEEDGEEIPAPSNVKDLKLEKSEFTSLIDVYMPVYRLKRENKAINRTVTLPAWLNARAKEANINVSQTLQNALKAQLGVME